MKYYRYLALCAVVVFAIPPSYAQDTNPDRTQERFRQMQTTMDQMPQATTRDQRRNLMGEHIKLMQEQMNGMRSMMGGMMDQARAMDGKMGSGNMMGPRASTTERSASTDLSVASQMQVMEQRMDIMQRMMEQMLKQMAQEQQQLWANG